MKARKKLPNAPKKVTLEPPKGSPMEKFHKAMKKIISVPKKDLKKE